MANRPAYIFEKSATADDVKASLKANGVCMIRGYLTDDKVVKLKESIKTLAYREHKNQLVEAQSHLGRYTVDEVNELGLPEVAEVLDDSLLKGIAEDFFKPYAPDYHKIYCHHDAENMDFNNAWHFDRGLTLKFFFYLNDVTADNGAFCYDLGSHRANSTKQHLWWETGLPMLNYVPEEEVLQPVSMEGPAGTLIFFDVAGYHQAGQISDGGERWVMRYHVRAGKRLDGAVPSTNPYGRRNWDYRSGCFTTRDNEKSAPWGAPDAPRLRDLAKNSARKATAASQNGGLGRIVSRVAGRVLGR